jgi:CDP-glycerol glycerophosphotransferase (TagB/SpsB family)
MKRYLFYVSQNYSFQILRPLQEAIHAQGDEVKWFFEGSEVNRNYLRADECLLSSVADVNEYSPLAIFAPGNMIPSFIEGLKVAIFHGFNVGKLNRRGEEDHFQIRGSFDLYCTQGPNTTERFHELAEQHGYFRVIETGWPAIDPLFDETTQSPNFGKPIILLCSTFSRNLTCAPHIYDQVARISRKGNWQWIVQFHPKMPADIIAKYKDLQSEHLAFIETDNVLPLLQKADVMVCDTSSVLVMFLLQQKPVVTYRNISPGPYLYDITDSHKLEDAIAGALSKPSELMGEIRNFISQTHPYSDGGSSERVLQAVDSVLAANLPLKQKPVNLIRNLKTRKKLAYWKFRSP